METAYDRLQDVGAGHHALKRTVFVVHQTHMHGRIPEDRNDVSRIEGFWNDWRVPDQLSDVRRLPGQVDIEHVLGLDNSHRGVPVALEDYESGVNAVDQRRRDELRRVQQID